MSSISEKEKMIFSTNLHRIMSAQGKKQSDIVEVFGITASTVSDWLNGKKYPRMDKVQMLADWLKVKKSDLIEEYTYDQTAPPRNVLKIAGRDGSYEEHTLTDGQLAAVRAMVDQFPDADNDQL